MEQGFTQIPNRIARDSSLDPYAKTVLLVLTSYADERGECWPSLATIAKNASCSRRKVIYALKTLSQRGLVTIQRRKSSDGDADSNLYRVHLKTARGGSAPRAPRSAHHAPGVVHHVHQGSAPRAPKQEPINNNQLNKRGALAEMATSKGEYLPEDWEPSDKAKQWTTENYPHVNAGLELEKFVDYWQAASGQNARKRDWDATWRNWIRRAERDYTRAGYKSQAQMLQEMKQTAHARAQGSALRLIAGGE